MSITLPVNVRPLTIPQVVFLEIPEATPTGDRRGFCNPPSVAFSDLEPEVIAQLCDDFRANLFTQAGKVDPATVVAQP